MKLASAIVAIGLASSVDGAAHANSFTNGYFSSNGGNGQFNYNIRPVAGAICSDP